MHKDALKKGSRILIHDDVLATGGTAAAAAELVKMSGAVICAYHFMVEILALNGRNRLTGLTDHIHSFVAC